MGTTFCDDLRCGNNRKAAIIYLGLVDMIAFTRIFCKGQVSMATFLESCDLTDLITTCYQGSDSKVTKAFSGTGKTTGKLEKEVLNGRKLQGLDTSTLVYHFLKQKGLLDKFPLFTTVYQICCEGRPITEMLPCLPETPCAHIKGIWQMAGTALPHLWGNAWKLGLDKQNPI